MEPKMGLTKWSQYGPDTWHHTDHGKSRYSGESVKSLINWFKGEWDGWKENKRNRSKANKILTSTVWKW